jgi:hypothetical protein
MKRVFLVPAGIAIAALVPQSADAATNGSNQEQNRSPTDQSVPVAAKPALTPEQTLTTYAVGESLFGFTLERGANGEVIAQHRSHSSHASHSSHVSHYSSRP